jgi:hypothetical protein
LIPAQFYLAPKSEGSSISEEMADPDYTKNKRKQDKAVDLAERKAQIKEAKRAKVSLYYFEWRCHADKSSLSWILITSKVPLKFRTIERLLLQSHLMRCN